MDALLIVAVIIVVALVVYRIIRKRKKGDDMSKSLDNVEKLRNVVKNVKNYGAVGDGVTDDTAAFASASAASDGAGAYVPDGSYIVDSTIDLNDFIGTGIVSLSGAVGRQLGAPDVYKRRVIYDLDFRFPGYSTVLTAETWDWLFPQCIYFHETELYMLYGTESPTRGCWLVVREADTGAYIKSFGLNITDFGEGIVVKTESTSRYLYAKHSSGVVGKWDITTFPADLGAVTASTTYSVNLNSFLSWDDKSELFMVQDGAYTTGEYFQRNRFKRMTDTFTYHSGVDFSSHDLWSISADIIDDGVKGQGITNYDGGYAIGYGTTYATGTTVLPKYLSGICLFTADAEKIADGLLDPDKFITILEGEGYTVDGIENEGVTGFNGGLYGVYVTRSHTHTGTGGILITEELVGEIDCRDAASTLKQSNERARKGYAFNAKDTGITNPHTGVEFDTIEEICQYMKDAQLTQYGFYTTGSTITDIDVATIASGQFVTLTTGNFYSFEMVIASSTKTTHYWITGGFGSFTQTTKIGQVDGATDTFTAQSGETVTVTNGIITSVV